MAKNQVVLTFAGDTRNLDRAAAKVRATTRRMGDDFDELGKRTAKKLPETIFAQFGNATSMALKAVPQQVQGVALGVGAAVGATVASAMGAAVTSGILLAVGGGVLAAGIRAAAKDPAVQAAWKTFGDRTNKATAGFGDPFKAPLIRAADTFGDSLERMAPSLNRMGATLAPVIDKLAPALAEMAERALPGIEKAAVASVPLFEKLAEHGPKLGDAIGKMFALISEGGPGATKFFDHLLTTIEVSLVTFGNAMGFLSKEYLKTVNMINGTKDAIMSAARAVEGAFRAAFNGVARAWNATVGKLSFSIPGWVPGLGGNSFNAPKLPTYHTGGIVPGAMGAETLAVLRAGERVTPTGGGGGQVITLRFASDDRAEIERLKRIVQIEGGGNVQAAFGR
jgi:hypothetical protein